MRRLLTAGLLCAALALTAPPALAQDSRQAGIEEVIRGQLEAFRADDLDRAFGYAAPGIQGIFGNPGTFGLMVQNGYPMVWRSRDAELLALEERDGRLWQRVRMRGPNGDTHLLDYEMIEGPEGWRIGAVVRIPSPDIAV